MTYKVQIDDVVRDATADEISLIEQQREEAEQKKVQAETKAEQKAVLLERLGITEAEAALLLS